jgi:NADPH:quinone reductase and related Zn-dependent oxidoreductases
MKAVEINKTGGPEVLEVKDISLEKPGYARPPGKYRRIEQFY